jgi:adenosylmethionine-8-amino-7-oxononanoate aminotransferase
MNQSFNRNVKGSFMPSSILHRDLHATLSTALAGEGIHLFDSTGKPYIDASGGAAVSCVGHSHPAVVEALREQMARLSYAHTSFFTTEPAEALARTLIDLAPQGFEAGRVVFAGSGSEAMEIALKLARQYHVERGEESRRRFVARRLSYHGNTLGALSISGNLQRRKVYEPLLTETAFISPCHPYRFKADEEDEQEYGLRVANELEDAILRLGPETVAAFIAEPVVGTTLGCVPAVPGYFRRVREICSRYGVLFIADEVMCGIGRTGTLFAVEAEDVCPDIVTVSKGLGGGYQPIAATLAAGHVVSALLSGSGKLANGHTYMGHTLACAASLAVLQTIQREALLDRVRQRGDELKDALHRTFGGDAHVGDIRGRGLFQAIEIVQNRETKTPFPRHAQIAEKLKSAALHAGLICYPCTGSADGVTGDHVLLAPPYIVEKNELDEIVRRLDTALTGVIQG